ncbi:MAG: aquaporin [Rhodothermales bacterium]
MGSALMIMVYMGGHISGAHYNSAVSLAAWMRGALSSKDVAQYMISQVLGAIAASLAVNGITGSTIAPAPAAAAGPAMGVEILFTFALALVVLHVATAKTTEGNSYFGLAIGFTVVVAAFAGGGISGGAFNPAVGIGPVLIDATIGKRDLWKSLAVPSWSAGRRSFGCNCIQISGKD